jgi:hypothetical protein
MDARDEVGGAGHYSRFWDTYVVEQFERNKRAVGRDFEYPGDEWGSPTEWEAQFQRLFTPAGVHEWERAIEIGQGSGKYSIKVLSQSAAVLHAFDVSAEFLKVCERRCQDWVRRGRLRLNLLNTDRPDYILAETTRHGWRRRVDGFYSIDSMVHVDLQYLVSYLITAGLVLRPGGKLILTLADATSDAGWRKLLEDIKPFFPLQGRPSAKFEWLNPFFVVQILMRIGFTVDLVDALHRDMRIVARLGDPAKADALERYLR